MRLLLRGVWACRAGFGRNWVEEFSRPALARLLPLLHHTSRCLLAALDGPAPGGLLVCGPAGSGTAQYTASVISRCAFLRCCG